MVTKGVLAWGLGRERTGARECVAHWYTFRHHANVLPSRMPQEVTQPRGQRTLPSPRPCERGQEAFAIFVDVHAR